MSVLVETTLGDLVFDLYTEERPRSCMNFLKLCKIKYYNFCCFHSVRRNFIAQSGDPTETGRGGVSVYSFVYGDQAKYFELELKPRIKHRTKGTISFVNNGNDMHGSQFFITLGDGLDFLDGKHTVFGQLAEGFDILEKLNEVICDDSHKPFQDVRITHTIVLEDPFDDPKDLPIPDRSPEPSKEVLESGRIAAGEKINDDDVSKEELLKKIEDKELAIGTKILETVGDIGDADLKPPENVLFVCKLNPVTNADDLKIIFSRFGKILSCEIIKDQKTGDSLCYGFVEFKEVEACEKAYFKMDNVLIDDRRIHVDFCQSVSKINKWHKSAAYTKANNSKDGFGYEMKERKNPKDKYSMIFDEEEKGKKSQVQEKHRKKDKPKKKSQKYRSDSSDSVSDSSSKSADDKRSTGKKTPKTQKKRVDSRKSLKRSYSSSDDDDNADLKISAKKKKNDSAKRNRGKSSDSDDCDLIKKSKNTKESKYSNSDSEDSDDKNKSKKFQEDLKKKKKAVSKNGRNDIRKTTSDDDKKNDFSRRKNDRRSSISKEKREVRSSSSSLQKRDFRSSLQKETVKKEKEPKKYSDDSDDSIKNEKSKKKFKKISLEECDTEEYTGEKASNRKNNRSSDSDENSDEDKKNKSRDYKKHTKRHSEGNKKRKKRSSSTDSSD